MKLEKVLEEVNYCDDSVILRQCMVCKEWLDDSSKIIYEARDQIKTCISHGICETCADDFNNKIDKL